MSDRKVAVVTGSTSGIGLEIARTLASNGYDVALSGLCKTEDVRAIESKVIDGTDARAFFSHADFSRPKEIEQYVSDAKSALGRLDILVNNAGVQHVSPVENFPPDKWDLILAVNLSAAFHMTRLVIPEMRTRGFGRIINIGSIHALIASPYKSAYVAAKHGLLGFAKTIALETGDCDVTINTLCPAYVKTPLVEKQIASQAKENNLTEEEVINKIMLEPMPKKQFISVDELSDTAAFLMSDSARNITAQTMVLDGGWTAR